jgi:hypothetical protein
MSAIYNIQLTIPGQNQPPIRQSAAAFPPTGECQIDIQTNGTWVVTGEYRDNCLRAISIKRKTNQETE